MKRVLAIDDDVTLLSALKRGLSYDGFVVDVAASGDEGLAAARYHTPDLVILDIMLPGIDGLEVLRRLRAADPSLPVLLLTGRDTAADQVQGLSLGADDYVVKPFTWDVLLARVHALLRRQDAERPPVLRFADLSLDTAGRRARRAAREFDLTTTEYELLRQFLEHPRRVLPRDFLMDRVWGFDFEGGTNVLETYVKQLRQKIESGGEDRLIHTIRGVGYVLREP
ncbi:MAG TPA: response regulator transcription factor [Thermomicrobiales bacterium]|nr:response regulator transcription factor [Thermomicrobiales bacterium]